jgi:hypothetical protein
MAEIDWFNIKSGETVLTSRPAQIKALIESSDLGVNRQSDKGWRLGKEWTRRLRNGRNDRTLISSLSRMSGGDVTDTQLLVALFEREAAADKQEQIHDDDAPFEQEYLDSIKPKQPKSSN